MRLRGLAQLVFVAALVTLCVTPPAEAQRGNGGHGKNRHRQPAPAPQEEGRSKDDQSSKDALAPGEYPLDGPQALEAVNRGEGLQALAYYERTAAEAEQRGDQVRAARALGTAAVVAVRLGRYQKAIQSGTRSIELFGGAKELTRPDLMAWASVHAQLGSAYRAVGDMTRARQVLEEGLEFANTRLSGRREGQVEGYLLNGLAMVAYAQQDYQAALARNTQAAEFFQDAESHLGPRAPERPPVAAPGPRPGSRRGRAPMRTRSRSRDDP